MDDEAGLNDINSIMDALDNENPGTALRLVRKALQMEGDDDPTLLFLAGRALLDLGRSLEAVEQLSRAIEIDPDDSDYRADLALALFRACRFREATEQLDMAMELDPRNPDNHELKALLLERERSFKEADSHFLKAATLSPENFPAPVRLDRKSFEKKVENGCRRLPDEFRVHLDQVAITVEDIPSKEILLESVPPMDPSGLLGLFVGVAVPDHTHLGPGGELPPRILLFKRNLERTATDNEELEDQITVTLYHELAHYLGFDEVDMGGLDLV